MDRTTPGYPGIVGLMAALVAASISITVVCGTLFHWLIAAAAIVTSCWAIKAINHK